MKEIEDRLKTINGGNILDVATGAGNFIHFIKEFNKIEKITAIDTVPQMGDQINKSFPDLNVEFQVMDANKLTFDDESFDTVCLSNSLHHMTDFQLMLSELKRVLKNNGILVINEMRSDQLDPAQLSHKMLHHWTAKRDRIVGMNHNETWTTSEIIKAISNMNFAEMQVLEYRWPNQEPKSQETIDGMLKMIDTIIERLLSDERTRHLVEEGREIKEYIRQNGYDSASSVFITARK